MTSAARAPGAGTAVSNNHQHKDDTEEEYAPVELCASSVSSVPVNFLMSSSMFLVVNSPVYTSQRKETRETSTY